MVDFIRFFVLFLFFCHEYSLENRACNLKRTDFVIQTMQYLKELLAVERKKKKEKRSQQDYHLRIWDSS